MTRPVFYVPVRLSPQQLNEIFSYAYTSGNVKFGAIVFRTQALRDKFVRDAVCTLYRGRIRKAWILQISRWISCIGVHDIDVQPARGAA